MITKNFRESLDNRLTADGELAMREAEWQAVQHRYGSLEGTAFTEALSFIRDARRSQARPRRELQPRKSAARTKVEEQRSAHDEALTMFYAYYFEHTTDEVGGDNVAKFRADHFKGAVLTRAEAGPWVEAQAAQDGKADVMTKTRNGRDVGWEVTTLSYAVDGQEWAKAVPINTQKVLGRLHRLAEHISKMTRWNEAEASFFVLTGLHPFIHSMSISTSYTFPYRAQERIVMQIQPSCSPQEVADFYAEFRLEHYGRLRRLSAKHAMLAGVFSQQPEPVKAATFFKAWDAWCLKNGQPAWRYARGAEPTLLRDGRQAWRRLVDPHGPVKALKRALGG